MKKPMSLKQLAWRYSVVMRFIVKKGLMQELHEFTRDAIETQREKRRAKNDH